jgi:hypothetical protein
LGEGPVDLIVLEDEEALKEAEPPRDRGAVLDARERGGLVGGEIGEVVVDAAEEIAGGEGRIDFRADGEVIDERSRDAVGPGEVSRTAGEGGAVDDIVGAGGVGEQGGPGGLDEDAGREAEAARGSRQGGGGFRGKGGAGFGRAAGSAGSGQGLDRNGGGGFNPGQGGLPEGVGAGFGLALQPSEVVTVGLRGREAGVPSGG